MITVYDATLLSTHVQNGQVCALLLSIDTLTRRVHASGAMRPHCRYCIFSLQYWIAAINAVHLCNRNQNTNCTSKRRGCRAASKSGICWLMINRGHAHTHGSEMRVTGSESCGDGEWCMQCNRTCTCRGSNTATGKPEYAGPWHSGGGH